MKNIIIAGPSRAGKSTLARKINEELNYFVISLDKLVAVFQGAYPQLNIKLNWNREKTADNLAPFLGHYLGVFSSADGRGLLPYSHGAVKRNRFVLEGGYFNFEKILPILKTYGIEELKERFLLIGLVQNNKPVEEFVSDFKKYDTEDDWTYNFNDDDLREIFEDAISFSRSMSDYLAKYGFTIYDTSTEREQVLEQIVEDIKSKLL
ncbi:MAG: DEAD/DEAH box helicase family protein [Eubacteriales bacterium]